MKMHSHLHPNEIGVIRLLPVLIWSKDKKLIEIARKYINDEFDDYINLLDLEDISEFENLEDLKIEEIIDQYNFHLIKLDDKNGELILIDDSRFLENYEDLEKILDNFGRKLIKFYHENTD